MKQNSKKPHGNKYTVHQRQTGWAVDCEQESKVSYAYKSKDRAISAARFLAKKHNAEAILLEPDGSKHELAY